MNGRQAGFDHSLRAYGKRFLSNLKASNRYSPGYLASLETTLAMAALYAEEKGWPGVQEITTEHLDEYLSYLQDRVRWFGGWTYAEPRKLSKGPHQRTVPPPEPVLQLARGARAQRRKPHALRQRTQSGGENGSRDHH